MLPSNVSTSVLQMLRATYKTINISATAAGLEIGLAEKTTRNMVSEGRFPIKTKKVSTKRVVSIFDLAEYLEGSVRELASKPIKKKGARTKKDRLEGKGRA